MAAPRHIVLAGRITTVVLLLIVGTMVTWFVTGMPKAVQATLADQVWAPCPPRYASARTRMDSTLVDEYVLKPRSRFEAAVTCGSVRAKRAVTP
jgi:hypothetical protein